MKKCRSYSLLQRALSLILSFSMALSVVAEIDLLSFFAFAGSVSAESAPSASDPDEYANETLLYRWENDNDYVNNAARPLYACRDSSFGGVNYRTIFHVYAFEGDTICIGSSVADSKIDINFGLTTNTKDKGSVDVVMTDLKGVKHPIDIRYKADTESGETEEGFVQTGFIENPGVEFAALNMHKVDGKFIGEAEFDDGTGGTTTYTYTPYTYTVTETGVYTFEFHSHDKGGKTGVNVPRNALNMPSSANGHTYNGNDIGGWIAALNLTVFDESGVEQHGRTYADFLSMEMGPSGSTGVKDAYYILTKDSYIYKMQFNNISPYTYNFFSNNKGIYDPDSTNGDIIYKSVKDIYNTNLFNEMGVEFRYPGTKDTDMLKSYYIFLEYPDDQLEGRLYEKAVQPDPATNLSFVSTIQDDDGNTIPGAYEGQGGYFVFDVEEATTATLRLEFKGELEDEKYAPVEISKAVTPHSRNYFFWNGKDGNGKVIPPGKYDINDIAFTVTTKAGEIHFPIIDMELANGGITFTRMSHIYDKEGNQLDSDLKTAETTPKNIYDYTRNVIYYDDSAIYYGEKITPTAAYSESEVNVAKSFFAGLTSTSARRYFEYTNVNTSGGEYAARNYLVGKGYISSIGDDLKIRVGDHSHTTNVINYFDEHGALIVTPSQEQKDMIYYLDSKELPVGKTTSSGGNSSTSDYGIANFWTFVPAKPATSTATEQEITIKKLEDNFLELTGRVFFDADGNGKYDSMSAVGDYMLKDVTLNLYKKSSDSTYDSKKKYVAYNTDNSLTEVNESNFDLYKTTLYELVETAQTTGDGSYKFTGLNYDPAAGTEYIYEVKSPGNNYELKSGNIFAQAQTQKNTTNNETKPYGYYADKSYTKAGNTGMNQQSTYKGTEVQHIVVGGTGVDPTTITCSGDPNTTHTVCAVDVGYYYETLDQTLEFKKVWDEPEKSHPDAVAYKVCYKLQSSNTVKTYAYPVLSAINSWQYTYTYPHSVDENGAVDNYYVDSEYYIKDGYIYKHTFEYNASSGKYTTFVGKSYQADLASLNKIVDEFNNTTGSKVESFSNIPDLSLLDKLTWGDPLDEEDSPYKAVIDRNFGSDTISVTITNAEKPGTIEIFKYHDTVDETNALQGATFRVYELPSGKTVDDIKKLVEANNISELNKLQVGSDTTRSNGRIAFPGLDSSKDYVVREMYAPAGYRILNEFYVVKAENEKLSKDEEDSGIYSVFESNYALLNIGNAPADKNFSIIKQIEGRSWQGADSSAGIDADSFSFNISNAFDSSIGNISEADGIIIDQKEQEILKSDYADEAAIIGALGKFAQHFQESGDKNTVEISYTNDFYKYTATDINNHEYTFEYPDRKASAPLLVDGKDESATAAFYDEEFPMAGVYTFTIKENDINIAGDDTLTKSPLEYTIKINVTRELNTGVATGTPMEKDNSHLVAEVSSITYRDTTDPSSLSQIFAGSSPLFTNKYAPAPAKQSTTYAIEKTFDRPGDWNEDDKFTVSVSGEDTETQNAIKNGNLVINGTAGSDFTLTTLADGTSGWTHTFTKTDHTKWEFGSFTFKDIVFPVQYVDKTTKEPWDPSKNDGQEYPPEKDMGNYTIKTLPVTYLLEIKEDIPAGVNDDKVLDGITYDDTVYYLEIILRNTEEGSEGTDSEEEDGIIDEMDLNLYKGSKDPDNLVADCKTVQSVVTEAEWNPGITKDGDKTVTWWYLTESKQLIQYTDSTGMPSGGYDKLIKKTESHENKSADGHTMTINNKYSASHTWAPNIIKTLNRTWTVYDKFSFTIVQDSGPKVEVGPTINITSTSTLEKDNSYSAHFDYITFTEAGEYAFTVTETVDDDTVLGKYTITVKVEDNGDGTMKLTNVDTTKGTDIEFVNNYFGTEFDLRISKKIIGRTWQDGDEFKFNITPDAATKAAIDSGILTMPMPDDVKNSDGSYTATLSYSSGDETKNEKTLDLGEIIINNTGALKEETRYRFTIKEEATDGMYCREPNMDLFITVIPKITPPGGSSEKTENHLVATYAHIVSGETPADTDYTKTGGVTIPFENVLSSTLTVEKKVVSNNAPCKEDFTFSVVFTYGKSMTPEKDYKITATKDGAEVKPESSDDNTLTYEFTLKDGESVVFADIPTDTEYTVSEIDNPTDDYVFLRVEDSGGTVLSGTTPVTNTISNTNLDPTLVFVNGEIKELPSAGGSGTGTFVVLGASIMAAASIMLIAVWYVRRKKTGREEQRG